MTPVRATRNRDLVPLGRCTAARSSRSMTGGRNINFRVASRPHTLPTVAGFHRTRQAGNKSPAPLQLRERWEGPVGQPVEKEVNYLPTHRDRLDDGTARQRGEPLGSGAMESTCRQDQTRFKRTGQFGSQTGDEALMCLETFRRNGRWHVLSPHSKADPPKTEMRPTRSRG